MKLISCGCCGVMIDADRILEPEKTVWDSDYREHKPIFNCPTCKREIFYHNGNMT